MTPEDFKLLDRLVKTVDAMFYGHLTILKFTTNWRVGFLTPADYDDIQGLVEGKTFAEAAQKAIASMRVCDVA